MMKLPDKINEITSSENSLGPYPPIGFIAFNECSLGIGDYFGLYWPFAKENQEPVICEMYHDEWRLVPRFSSLDVFLQWCALNDYDYGDQEIDDPKSCQNIYQMGNTALKNNNLDKAIQYFKQATEIFPEISDYWQKLASQMRRLKKVDEFEEYALESIKANWVFGFPSENAIRSFKTIRPDGPWANDPLVKQNDKLSFSFHGKKINDDYIILKDIITEYLDQGDYLSAIHMQQNYGFVMYSETVSFQERYHFDLELWRKDLSSLCIKHLGTNRNI